MKTMAIALLACWTLLPAKGAEWLTDLSRGQAMAREETKMVLIHFTGSDRGGWCDRLNKEVLDTAQFKDYAAKNLVLVQLDFPRKKVQSPEVKNANKELSARYKVDEYPTLVVLNKDGKEVGRQTGYTPGGAKEFISKLEKLKR
jgi:thioredoxin-related protein